MSDRTHQSITIIAATLFGFSIFQFTQILADRDNLHKAQEQVQKNIEQADKVLADNQKMLDQLNAIAIGTQRLADAGNPNAKEIVAQLSRLGIKINPNFKAGQEGQPATAPEAPKHFQAPAVPPAVPPAPPAPPEPKATDG